MGSDSGPKLPPFPSPYRASGLLLHVTSLPSPYGIGDVGPAAIAWIAERNWSWRCTEELLAAADFHSLRDLTKSSKRMRMHPNPAPEMANAAL